MNTGTFRHLGVLSSLTPAEIANLCERRQPDDAGVRAATGAILARVAREGDAALHSLARELDGVTLGSLDVPRGRWREALATLDAPLRSAMERAAANLAAVHHAFRPVADECSPEPGIRIGRRPDPLARVGVYAPGGRASYPSSLLMAVVPARVAGVGEVIVCSPPGPDGFPAPAVLAAAELAGADRLFAVGGTGAIAAMAFGTATVPRVDRVVGPGNAWVAEAKAQLAGTVSIDCPAGPSEVLIVADTSADAEAVARELVAQAEHDTNACVIALAIGEPLGRRIAGATARALSAVPRNRTAASALANGGAVLWTDSLDQALDFAAAYAPEHLMLAVADPQVVLPRVRNAGSVFLGTRSSVVFGDYMTGANHVLPTGGLARSYSGLSPLDFVRWTTWQSVDADAAASLAGPVSALATAERLPAHAIAARAWSHP